jgi:hypothetical protein
MIFNIKYKVYQFNLIPNPRQILPKSLAIKIVTITQYSQNTEHDPKLSKSTIIPISSLQIPLNFQ